MSLSSLTTPMPAGVLETLRGFRDGTLTQADYLSSCLARAAECEPWLHSFVSRPRHLPDSGPGPLGGIPVGIKDIIDTADMATENGAAADAGRVPAEDAWVVERIRSLGGIVFGKTVTTEYAWRHPGATVNPHDPVHTPGGSSSGSAAAVAAGIVPLALGTQTVGSVIRPAAYCGVVGLKPSYGAIPRIGVHKLAGSLDHVGFFARSVDDVAYALSLLAAAGTRDPHGLALPDFVVNPEAGVAPSAAPRLALLQTRRWDDVEAPQRAVLEAAAARLRACGATVQALELSAGFDGMWDWIQTILAVEASAIHHDRVRDVPDRMSEVLKALVASGRDIPGPDYVRALERQALLRHALAAELGGFDAILTVPAAGVAPRGLDYTGDAAFCAPWTFLGVPAVTLPAGMEGGLPLGIQLVGRYREDLSLLRVAKWSEAALRSEQG